MDSEFHIRQLDMLRLLLFDCSPEYGFLLVMDEIPAPNIEGY